MPDHSFIDPDGIIHTFTPEMLEGSILGKVLEEKLSENDEFYIAPKLGINFVEPWCLVRDEEEE